MAKKPNKIPTADVESMTLEQAIAWVEGWTPQQEIPPDVPWRLIRVLRHALQDQRRMIDAIDRLGQRVDEAFAILLPEDEATL